MKAKVVLSCSHVLYFEEGITPRKDDHIWCRYCEEYKRVESAPDAYKIDCQQCEYVRPFGAARTNAEIAAARHSISNTGHVVKMFNGRTYVRKFGQIRDENVTKTKPESNRQIPY